MPLFSQEKNDGCQANLEMSGFYQNRNVLFS
jgi:hypothetical protein